MKPIAAPSSRALGPVVLLALLAACSASPGWAGTSSWSSATASGGGSTGWAAGSSPEGSVAVSTASCSGDSCTVTLGGSGSRVHVLRTDIVLEAVERGAARLRVGDVRISCSAGGRIPAGPLDLTCTDVTQQTVTFTVVLR